MVAATIFALSSGAPPAGVAVVRITGPDAGEALIALHGRLPDPRRATFGGLRSPEDGALLDRALLLWLPGPGTASGEDMAELHLHGGRAVVRAVLAALGRIPGFRAAEPGEFTRRAFANGVIDLAEAEGLADLIAAETEGQRRQALQLAGGVLSRCVEGWQARVLTLSARVEAMLDFADEADVGVDVAIGSEIAALAEEMLELLRRPPADRLRDGVRVVLAGPPNSGKSTLLNAIAGREAAIVSPVPGTTRDLIEVPLAIRGQPFVFTDTAGLRNDAGDRIEEAGIARAEAALAAADILLWLGDVKEAPTHPRVLRVHARSDVPGRAVAPDGADLTLSALTGGGMEALLASIAQMAGELLPHDGDVALNARQRAALADSAGGLIDAAGAADPVLMAEGLRIARRALDRFTGRAGAEEMLDALFGRFCIGK